MLASTSDAFDLLRRQTLLVLNGEAMAVLARRVVERATLETRVMKLAVRSVLVNVVPIWFLSANGFELAQGRIIIIT